MASVVLVPCLVTLRAEFNSVAPGRDKASDGWVGDPSHAARQSDHNADSRGLVHAIDVDMTGPWPTGFSMDRAVQMVVTRHRTGLDDRLQNIIWKRTIWSRSWGWTARAYTGSNPHDKHAHFSARYTTAQENDTSPWGLTDAEEGDMLVRKGDKGEEVKYWQHLLTELGYGTMLGEPDGEYGPKMEAAVNADRKARGLGATTSITGWHAFALQRALAQKFAGKAGTPGAPGRDGRDGKDGGLGGTLTVVGGQLIVEAAPNT